MMNERDIICKPLKWIKSIDFKDQSMYQSPMADLNDSKLSGNVLSNVMTSPVPNNKRRKFRVQLTRASIGFKHIKHAPTSGSEPRINKVQAMVDRLFGETPFVQKPQHYVTINDYYLGDSSISDPAARRHQYEELQAEVKANDAQVLKTNVRIGRYNGWKPRDTEGKKALPPKSNQLSKFSNSDVMSPSTQISQGLPKEIPNLIWSESDMFTTTKQQY